MENNIPDTLSVPKPQFSRNYHLKYCFQNKSYQFSKLSHEFKLKGRK